MFGPIRRFARTQDHVMCALNRADAIDLYKAKLRDQIE